MQIFLVAFSWFFTFFINYFPSWTTIIHGVLVAFGQSNVIILALTIALALVNCGVYQLRQIYGYTILQERNVESASSSDEPFGRRFSFTQILLATQHFNESLVIGKGGFGKVYKGIIHGRPEVLAIKRLNPDSKQGAREFWREIDTLSKLRHVHLVSLLGYCMERDEMIIVYEYMPGGTIADNLYKFGRDGKERIPLTWQQRLKICIGVARGLDYLHTGFQHCIIHLDVKDTNILLDENLVAKISDFGLSKLVKTHDEVSTKVKGTIGYMDPGYIMTHKPSTKSDVYAFGIALLVVLSGRPAVERRFFEKPKYLLDCYRKCLTKGETNKIIDPCLQGEILTKSLTCFMETVEKCLHRRTKKRPSMAQLVVHLESALDEQIGANAIHSTLNDDTVVAQSFSDRSKEQFEFDEFQFTPITKESVGSLPDERNNTSKDIHEADQHHTQMMKEHDRRIQEVDHHSHKSLSFIKHFMKKVVFKLEFYDEKIKQKAMQSVSGLSGVVSISVDMKKNKLTVIGDIDPIIIVAKLRKTCHTEILSIGPAKEPEKKKDDQPAAAVPKKAEPKKEEPKKMSIVLPKGIGGNGGGGGGGGGGDEKKKDVKALVPVTGFPPAGGPGPGPGPVLHHQEPFSYVQYPPAQALQPYNHYNQYPKPQALPPYQQYPPQLPAYYTGADPPYRWGGLKTTPKFEKK